jgi:chemotaxis protein histidine kinase CheA
MSKSSGAARLSETVPPPEDLTGGDFGPPLDLVHLARHCLGDRELEDELLGLFRRQARTLTAELSDPSLLSLESKGKIAHKLRGSALAVGARRVASAAWRIEELAAVAADRPGPDMNDRGAEARAVLALLFAMTEAVAEIERICG